MNKSLKVVKDNSMERSKSLEAALSQIEKQVRDQ